MSRRLYGDSQVCSDVTDNQCTPYPVILQLISQANRSMQGGLCEGLAVLSLRLANDPSSLTEFQNVDNVSELVKKTQHCFQNLRIGMSLSLQLRSKQKHLLS
ncbi:MAG: hypothetical protein CM15mV33_610 [uncultured marine virus]|nr:MAG: hypothetical protein CM15mV33_610 [uncultured marine virus]